jgi:hypothetical protein
LPICLSSVVPSTVETEFAPVRARGRHSLASEPTTPQEAWGCCAEYLSGTGRGWERWNVEARVRDTPAFKALAFVDFRTKAARELRDAAYARRSIALVHQASRFRGKANIATPSFSPTDLRPDSVVGFRRRPLTVLKAFAAMVGAYCSLLVERSARSEFVWTLIDRRVLFLVSSDRLPGRHS